MTIQSIHTKQDEYNKHKQPKERLTKQANQAKEANKTHNTT